MSTNKIKKKINRDQQNKVSKPNNIKSDGWMNILTGQGIIGRDKNVATTFRMCRKFSVAELDEIYRSDGMTRRVIDIVAEEMTRQGWDIEGDDEGMLQARLEELNVNKVLTDILRWSRLYGGALGVIGVADGRSLDEPINYNNIRDIQWIHVFDRFSVSSADGTIDGDLNSPNYGLPKMYLVTDARTGKSFYVHHSRVLRCDWNELTPRWTRDNDSWGDPVMQTIYEELKNYSTTFANCGTLVQDFVNHVLKIPDLANILSSECGDSDVQNRINILNMSKSIMNTMVIDSEESYEKVTTNINGISELLDRFMLSLSSVTAIPVTLLFGRAPAGLNATGENDVRNFYDMIKQKQECKLRPMLEKLIKIIFLSKDYAFAGVEPEDWKLEFTPLWQNSEEQEATIRRTIAETDAIYIDRGVLDPEEVAKSRFGGSRYSMNTEIDIEERGNGFTDKDLLSYLKSGREPEKEQE